VLDGFHVIFRYIYIYIYIYIERERERESYIGLYNTVLDGFHVEDRRPCAHGPALYGC
jgi:hypothetical protein